MKKYLTFLLLLLLVACSSMRLTPNQFWLAPAYPVSLVPLAGVTPFNTQQLLTLTYGNQRQQVLALLQVDQQQLQVVLLSLLGVRLLSLQYDGQQLNSQYHLEQAKAIDDRQMLADILLSYWPASAWQPLLPPNWQLQDSPTRREIRDEAGELVVSVDYQLQQSQRLPIQYQQHRFNYQLQLQTLTPTDDLY